MEESPNFRFLALYQSTTPMQHHQLPISHAFPRTRFFFPALPPASSAPSRLWDRYVSSLLILGHRLPPIIIVLSLSQVFPGSALWLMLVFSSNLLFVKL